MRDVPGARIRYRRSEAPPPFLYAITLEVMGEGGYGWRTVRLWDNADRPDEHHEHVHTRGGGKQYPRILEFDSTNDAMAAAVATAKRNAGEIVRQWRAS